MVLNVNINGNDLISKFNRLKPRNKIFIIGSLVIVLLVGLVFWFLTRNPKTVLTPEAPCTINTNGQSGGTNSVNCSSILSALGKQPPMVTITVPSSKQPNGKYLTKFDVRFETSSNYPFNENFIEPDTTYLKECSRYDTSVVNIIEDHMISESFIECTSKDPITESANLFTYKVN